MINLRKIRLARKIKAKDFATAMGTSEQQLARLEKGERRMTVEWLKDCEKAFKKLGHPDIKSWMLIDDAGAPPAHLYEAEAREIDGSALNEGKATQNRSGGPSPAEIEKLVASFSLLGKKDRNEVLKIIGIKLVNSNLEEE